MEFCEFVEVEYATILKHINIRWLSLERVIERILKVYKGLKAYFESTGNVNKSLMLNKNTMNFH